MFVPLLAPGLRAVAKACVLVCVLLLGGWTCLQQPTLLEAQTVVLAPRSSSSLSPEKKRTVSGHYRRFCSRCHEPDFTGEPDRIPDFTNRGWHKRRSDAQLLSSILEGKGGQMPAYRGRLSEGEARDLVVYIREAAGLEANSNQAGPDDFSRRFEELQKELEELRKQYRELTRESSSP